MSAALALLAAELASGRDPIAAALLVASDRAQDGLDVGVLVESGPRASGHPAGLGLVAEAVREGHLMHRGRPRLLPDTDRDLVLLAGDRCYAFALERLAAAGDLESIELLAGLIVDGADAVAGGDERGADTLWEAAAVTLGWGPQPELVAATIAAGAGEAAAREALGVALAAAHERLGIVRRPVL